MIWLQIFRILRHQHHRNLATSLQDPSHKVHRNLATDLQAFMPQLQINSATSLQALTLSNLEPLNRWKVKIQNR